MHFIFAFPICPPFGNDLLRNRNLQFDEDFDQISLSDYIHVSFINKKFCHLEKKKPNYWIWAFLFIWLESTRKIGRCYWRTNESSHRRNFLNKTNSSIKSNWSSHYRREIHQWRNNQSKVLWIINRISSWLHEKHWLKYLFDLPYDKMSILREIIFSSIEEKKKIR